MKLKQYLIKEDINKIKFLLERDCSQFLKESKRILLYRGVSEKKDLTLKELGIIKLKSRQDRKPTNTPLFLHQKIDQLFFKKFKIKPRSNGIFVSSSFDTSSIYGESYLFFPFNGYKYIWSSRVTDLFVYFNRFDKNNLENEWKKRLPDTIKIINSYKTTNLVKAIESETEIMFICDYYYLVEETKELIELMGLKD